VRKSPGGSWMMANEMIEMKTSVGIIHSTRRRMKTSTIVSTSWGNRSQRHTAHTAHTAIGTHVAGHTEREVAPKVGRRLPTLAKCASPAARTADYARSGYAERMKNCSGLTYPGLISGHTI
jgi:hypothetical protein